MTASSPAADSAAEAAECDLHDLTTDQKFKTHDPSGPCVFFVCLFRNFAGKNFLKKVFPRPLSKNFYSQSSPGICGGCFDLFKY